MDILTVAPPMRAHAFATLSEALLRQGKPAEALAAAEEAMKLIHAVSGVEEGEPLHVRLAYVEALIANGKLTRRGAPSRSPRTGCASAPPRSATRPGGRAS